MSNGQIGISFTYEKWELLCFKVLPECVSRNDEGFFGYFYNITIVLFYFMPILLRGYLNVINDIKIKMYCFETHFSFALNKIRI